jgi:hypothetical protein
MQEHWFVELMPADPSEGGGIATLVYGPYANEDEVTRHMVYRLDAFTEAGMDIRTIPVMRFELPAGSSKEAASAFAWQMAVDQGVVEPS